MKLDIKPREGMYAAPTGQLRFVERQQANATNTRLPRLKRILQQEWAVIEDDGKGNRKQYFQWRDVPTETEGTETPQ